MISSPKDNQSSKNPVLGIIINITFAAILRQGRNIQP
jgi:hypothetical protein